MTGWRCGWAIGPKAVVAQCNAIQSHSTSNINSITQKAAIAALTGPAGGVTEMLDEYRKRRDAVHALADRRPAVRLREAVGRVLPVPVRGRSAVTRRASGRPASWPRRCSRKWPWPSRPGEGFDAPGFFRLSYATSMERLREGVDRMFAFVATMEKERPTLPSPGSRPSSRNGWRQTFRFVDDEADHYSHGAVGDCRHLPSPPCPSWIRRYLFFYGDSFLCAYLGMAVAAFAPGRHRRRDRLASSSMPRPCTWSA